MNCKNCESVLNPADLFCSKCGAKVITERITIQHLLSNLLNAFGWDSNFIITIRHLISKPEVVLKEYIAGTRKKYANPFAFFGVILAISVFVVGQYSEEFVQMTTDMGMPQTETIESALDNGETKRADREMFGYKNESEFRKAIGVFQMKYYNLLAFLILPIYALIAFIVFRKPYNYGEHLVINTFIQSVTSGFSILLFVLSLIVGVNLLGSGILIVAFLYYSYVYKRLYKLTFGQLLVKILKFIGLLLVLGIISVIIGFIYAILAKVK